MWINYQNISYFLIVLFSVIDAIKYSYSDFTITANWKRSLPVVVLFVSTILIIINYFVLGVLGLITDFIQIMFGNDDLDKNNLMTLVAFIVFQIPLYTLTSRKTAYTRKRKYNLKGESILEGYANTLTNAWLFLGLLMILLVLVYLVEDRFGL